MLRHLVKDSAIYAVGTSVTPVGFIIMPDNTSVHAGSGI